MIYLYIALCVCTHIAVYYWGKSHGHTEGFKDGKQYESQYREWRQNMSLEEAQAIFNRAVDEHLGQNPPKKKTHATRQQVPKV